MLINLRNALMTGKRLPYDAEVEYLESTGTQYINTGVLPTSSTSVDILYEVLSSQLNTCIFSGRTSAESNSFSVWNDINGHYRFDFTASAADNKDGPSSIIGSYVSLKKDGNRNFVDGVEITANAQKSFSCVYPAYLFAMNNGGVANFFVSARVASCKIWQNGTLVRDFIPVRKGTVGYLYDRVSGKLFGNAGTGDFVLGPDVVPVEYIESHGTEWIDTGVVGYKTTKIESSCALKNATTAYPAMWGARTNSYINDFQVYYQATSIGGIPTSIILRTGNSQKEISMSDIGASTLIGTRLNVIVADGTIYVNDRAFTTPAFSNFTTPHSILAFCQYSSRPANQGAFVYWGLKMWQSESLIRSFIPVRVGTDATSWDGAMMDVLTRRIYRNAGTGAFTYGNDIKYPIPA